MKLKLFLFFLIINAQNILAQNNKPVAEIDFDLYDNKYIIFDALIHGNKVRCYFDTGATATVLDTATAEKLGITADYTREIQGASGKENYDIALNQTITIDAIELNDVNAVLKNTEKLKASLSQKFDVIIGYNILKHYKVQMDYTNKKIILYDPNAQLNLKDYQSLEFEFNNNIPIPQFKATIQLDNGNQYHGRVFFDSGAGLSLLVNAPFNADHKIVNQVQNTLTSSVRDLSGKKKNTINIGINKLRFSEFELKDLPIKVSTAKSGVSAYKGYLGILGSEIIRRFDIVTDYANKRLYLKKNANYEEAFEFPLSGIKLISKGKNILIDQVAVESPAYKQGLRNGAVILSVNGQSNLSLKQYKNLLKQEGQDISLKVLQGRKEITIEFKLNRLL